MRDMNVLKTRETPKRHHLLLSQRGDYVYSKNFGLTPIASCSIRRNLVANQQGMYFMFSAITLAMLFAFVALGIEVGRWYAIQAEISKSVDGAAFAGAANSGNFADEGQLITMVQDVANANFPEGMLGTENPIFTVVNDGTGKITVDGRVSAVNSFARVMGAGLETTDVASLGVAKLRKFEIVLVLDESTSMEGDPIDDLRTAATAFVQSFASMESDPDNQMGLVTFSSGVQKRYALTDEFVSALVGEIGELGANGWTNAEEALDRVQDDGSEGMGFDMGWSDQSGFPPNERTGQYVIFFSDGAPTAFRAPFSTNGSAAVEAAATFWNNRPYNLRQLDQQNVLQAVGGDTQAPIPTGNGTTNGPRYSSNCTGSLNRNSWKWWILDPNYDQDGNSNNPYSVAQSTIGEDANPLYGQNPIVCIPQGDLFQYGFLVAKHMAIQHAQEIKTDREFQIYTVGLGEENPSGPFALDPEFLRQISSGPEFSFLANNSTDLTALFLEISNRIKLVLLE